MPRLETCLAIALGACLFTSPSRAIEDWGTGEGERTHAQQLGPASPDSPLPPAGPYAAGEPDAPEEEEADTDKAPRDAEPTLPPIESETQRAVPNYDGREEETSAGNVVLWVPRVLLSPLYFVSEYVVRRPLGWFVTTAERKQWPALLVDFFTFGPERNAGIIPTGLIDFGLRPSVGLYFFWDDAFVDANDIRIRAATGGLNWWRLKLIDRYQLLPGQQIYARGELSFRPDHVFNGFGPVVSDQESRFRMDRLEAAIGYDADLWASSGVHTAVGIRSVDYDPTVSCCSDPALADSIAAGRFPAPAGLDTGFSVARQRVAIRLDTRPERMISAPTPGIEWASPPGTGVKLELRAEHAAGLKRLATTGQRLHWINYGATVGGFVDPTESQRVLGLELIADFAEPFSDAFIPFTEQVTLGGDRPMQGFLEGRLVDRSALVARLTYSWPVWVWLDGIIHYDVGNVFGQQLEGLELDLLRSSFGLGLRAAGERDHALEFLVAAGTEPFRDGGAPEEFRFVLGASSGF